MIPIGTSVSDAFRQFTLPPESTPTFKDLTEGLAFEHLGRGRTAAVVFRRHASDAVPTVRTTAIYDAPAQQFTPTVTALADQICMFASSVIDASVPFNNGMLEIYDKQYRTMGFHSDMALDLTPRSTIAIYSVYDSESPDPRKMRQLVVKHKERGDEETLVLAPGTVTVFSVANNRRFLHKIVAGSIRAEEDDVRWLGVTLRTTCTFVKFHDGVPRMLMLIPEDGDGESPSPAIGTVGDGAARAGSFLVDGSTLLLAPKGGPHAKEMYRWRTQENAESAFVYPRVGYTLSPSDLMCPASVPDA
jgi:hypothetical protein